MGLSMVLTTNKLAQKIGMNVRHFSILLSLGVMELHPKSKTKKRNYIDESEVKKLALGEHYVVCKECGSWQGQITTKHLRSCSGMVLEEYKLKYESALILSRVVSKNKEKTQEQKKTQSEKLKERFQTSAGELTRQQISNASKRLMKTGYKEVLVERLTQTNKSPERRERQRQRALKDWQEGGPVSSSVKKWAASEEAKVSAAHARTFVKDQTMKAARAALTTTSKLHRDFKKEMVSQGLSGFISEFPFEYYELDEANPDLKLCVEIDGCYWHGCEGCGFEGMSTNRRVDKSKNTLLSKRGWELLRIKECEIKQDTQKCILKIQEVVCCLKAKG